MDNRVYIFIQGLEEERILEGYRAYPSNRVIIIRNSVVTEKNKALEEKVEEFIESIKKKLKYAVSEFSEVYINFFDFIEAFKGIEEIIRRERSMGREVYINVTGGTRLVAGASLLASFIHGAHPIYVSAGEYERLKVICKKAGEIYEIPPVPIRKVSDRSIEILKTLLSNFGENFATLEELAEAMGKKFSSRKEKSAALSWLNYHIKRLENDGFVNLRFNRREIEVKITPSGILIARAPEAFTVKKEKKLVIDAS